MFVEAGYTVYCSGEVDAENGKNEQGGVGLAVEQTLGTHTSARPTEFIGNRSGYGCISLSGVCPD